MALIKPSQRLAALHSAKTLLTGGENTALFSKTSAPAPNPTPMIRIAEYILTGVDYRDADPAAASNIHGHNGLEEETPMEKDGADKEEEVVQPPVVMSRAEYDAEPGEDAGDRGILIVPNEDKFDSSKLDPWHKDNQ